MKDYYYILGIEQIATESEIKTAYRKLSLKFHPDKNNGEKFFEDRFKEIQEAYETLYNQSKRSVYDNKLKAYNSDRNTNRDSNGNEQEKWKAKEEYQRREEEIRKEYNAKAKKDKEEAELRYKTKSTNSTKLNENSKTDSHIMQLLGVISVVCVGLLIYYISNKEKDTEYEAPPPMSYNPSDQNQIPNVDTSTFILDSIRMNQIQLVIDNELVKFSEFPSTDYYKENKDSKTASFIDIDNDGVTELYINYFTGGAHCCFEYYIFKRTSNDIYKNIFHFEGGENSFSIDKNKIIINFYEQLGYFFTCYACGINDKLPYKQSISEITLAYTNNKFTLEPTRVYLNKIIIRNLEVLKSLPLPVLDTFGTDDGTRRAYAEHLIAFYFNNQKDSITTRDLFDRYYIGEDKEIVYDKILDHIENIISMDYTINEFSDRFVKYFQSPTTDSLK